jgi:hypothetical protein
MARFMERKVDKVKEAIPRIIGGHGGENKFPSPDKNYKKNDNPPAQVKGIHFRLDKKDKLFERSFILGCSLFFFGCACSPSQNRSRVFIIFFKNNSTL